VSRELKEREKITEWVCVCNISYGMQMKKRIGLTGLLLRVPLSTRIKACVNAMEIYQSTFN
jgi:hypothetical protein